MYQNRLSLIGFSGKEPEQKFTKNGAAYHGPVARHQNVLEERQRRMGVTYRMASNHRLVEAW